MKQLSKSGRFLEDKMLSQARWKAQKHRTNVRHCVFLIVYIFFLTSPLS